MISFLLHKPDKNIQNFGNRDHSLKFLKSTNGWTISKRKWEFRPVKSIPYCFSLLINKSLRELPTNNNFLALLTLWEVMGQNSSRKSCKNFWRFQQCNRRFVFIVFINNNFESINGVFKNLWAFPPSKHDKTWKTQERWKTEKIGTFWTPRLCFVKLQSLLLPCTDFSYKPMNNFWSFREEKPCIDNIQFSKELTNSQQIYEKWNHWRLLLGVQNGW